MKRLLICISIFTLLFAPFVFSGKENNPKSELKVLSPGVKKDNNGEGKPETTQQKIHWNMTKEEKQLVIEKIKNETIEKKQILELNLQNISNRDKQKIFRNQNRVREAVMTLLALRDVTNITGVGENISVIARSFNNSVSKTIKAEEAIHDRNPIIRFLFGGDEKVAATIEAELNNNRVMLEKLEKLKTEYDPEFQRLIEEQIQLIQQEQDRLMQLAEKEKGNTGLLGWLFK